MSKADTRKETRLLDDNCALYRAVLDSRWIKKGIINPRVFMRRSPDKDGNPRDVDGLSVALSNGRDEITTCTEEAKGFNDCTTVCRIFAGQVRALGFNAVEDNVNPSKPNHAVITGLPDVPPADIATTEGKQARADALYIGFELANRAVVAWYAP